MKRCWSWKDFSRRPIIESKVSASSVTSSRGPVKASRSLRSPREVMRRAVWEMRLRGRSTR